MENKEELLLELKALLQKYNVSIEAGMESDTQAIFGEHIHICDSKCKTVFKFEGWSLNHSDIDTKQ